MAVVSTTAPRLRLNKSSASHHPPSRSQPKPSAQPLLGQTPSPTTHPQSNNPRAHIPSNPTSLNPARLERVQADSKQPSSQISLRPRKPKRTSPSKPTAGPRHSNRTPIKPPKSRRDILREESKPLLAHPPSWAGPGTPTIVLDDILLPQSPTEDPLILRASPRKRTQLLPIRPIAFNQSLHVLSDSNQSTGLAESHPDQTQDLDVEPPVSNPSPATEPPVTSAGTNCEDVFLRPTSHTQLQSPHDRPLEHHHSSNHRPTGQVPNGQPSPNTPGSTKPHKAIDSAHSPRPGGPGSSSEQVSSPTHRKSLSLSVNTTSPAFLPSLHDSNSHLKSQPVDILDQQDSDSGSSASTIMASRAIQQARKETNLISFSSSPACSPKPTRSPLKSTTNTDFHDLPHDLFHNPTFSPRSPRARTDASTSSQPFNPSLKNPCATRLPTQPSTTEPSNPEPGRHPQIRGAIHAARTSARFHSASPSLRRSRDPSVHSPLNLHIRFSPARAPARPSPSPASSTRPSLLKRPVPSGDLRSPNVPDHSLELSSQAANNQSLRSTVSESRRSSLNQHAYAITLLPDRAPSVVEGSASPSGLPRRPPNAVVKPATPPRPRVWDDENSFVAFQVEDSSLDVDLTITCDEDVSADEDSSTHVRKRQKLSLGHVEMVMSDLGRTMGRAGRRKSALRVRYSMDGVGNRSLAEIEEGTDEDGERAMTEDGGQQDRVLQDEELGLDQRRSRHAGAAPSPSRQLADLGSQTSQLPSARRPTQILPPVEERRRDRLSESDQAIYHTADAGHASHEPVTQDERRSQCSSEPSADNSDQPGCSERAAYFRRVKAEDTSDGELPQRDKRAGHSGRHGGYELRADSEDGRRRLLASGKHDHSDAREEARSHTYSSERLAASRHAPASALQSRSGSETRQDTCGQAVRAASPHEQDGRLSAEADAASLHSPPRPAHGAGVRRGTSSSSVTGHEGSVADSHESESVVEVGGRAATVIEIGDSESSLDEYESDAAGHGAQMRQSSSRASSRPGPSGFIRPSEDCPSPRPDVGEYESDAAWHRSQMRQSSSSASSRPGPGGFVRPSEKYPTPRPDVGEYESDAAGHRAQMRQSSSRASSRPGPGGFIRPSEEYPSPRPDVGLERDELGRVGRASSQVSDGRSVGRSKENSCPVGEERRREAADNGLYEQLAHQDARQPSASSRASSRISAGRSAEYSKPALEERRRKGSRSHAFDEQSGSEDFDSQDKQSDSGGDEDKNSEYHERAGDRRTVSRSVSAGEKHATPPRVPIFISSSPPAQGHGHSESESEEGDQVTQTEEGHRTHEARLGGSDSHGGMSKSGMSDQDQDLSMTSRPNGLERFKRRAMAKQLTSTPPGAAPRPSPFPHLSRTQQASPRARAITPAGAPLVEISSADPKVAARVAALLKVHHGFVPHGCKAENAEAMDDSELEMEMEMSIQREEAQAERSLRANPGLLRAVQTRLGGLEEALAVRDGSPMSASRRSHRSLLDELEQLKYRPCATRWSQMDWKILEACLRKAQRTRARQGAGSAGLEPGDVVLKMLSVLGMGIGNCEQEWEWSKMVNRVIALQKRRPSERGSASRGSSATPGLRARAPDDRRPEACDPTYPSLDPVRRAMSRARTPPTAPPMSDELLRKACLDTEAYLSRKGKRRVGQGKIWEIIGKFEDRIEEGTRKEVGTGGKKRSGGGPRGVKRVRSG